MMKKKNPISARSKRLITEALLSIMEEEPFSKISIRDIVEKAGLTRQTFYHNFDSKEAVVLHKLDELFEEYFQFLVDNRVTKLEDVIWLYFRFWQKNDSFIKILMKNNLVYLLEIRYPEYFKLVQMVYLRDVSLSEHECEYAYAFVCGAIINLLVTWVRSGEIMTPKEMSVFIMDIVDGKLYDTSISKVEAEKRIDNIIEVMK